MTLFRTTQKTRAYDATATQTMAQAFESAKSPEAREAFRQAAEWTGWDAIATAEIRHSVARLLSESV